MRGSLGNVLHALGDLVIPRGCAACGARLDDGECFCRDCVAEVQLCTETTRNQPAEQKWTTLDNPKPPAPTVAVPSRALCIYDGPVGQAIRAFKYKRRLAAGSSLAKWLASKVPAEWLSQVELIVPVPLHPRRLLMRGFNQAQVLFQPLANLYDLPMEPHLLARLRHTRPQVGLQPKERMNNVAGAFSAQQPTLIQARKVLVVDDVFTTGATVSECSKVLLEAGAVRVSVLTLAKTNSANDLAS